MTRIGVVVNPVRDPTGAAVTAVRVACRHSGRAAPIVLGTTREHPGGQQVSTLLDAGVDRVIVAGGDGTVREVAGALAASSSSPAPVPLAILPIGTANLAARTLGLPVPDRGTALKVALGTRTRRVDLGEVTWWPVDGPQRSSAFLVLVGIGYDAATLLAVRPRLKHRLGWPAYLLPGLAMLRQPLLPVTLRTDDRDGSEQQIWSLLAATGARIPLGVDLLPGARPDDGRLHLLRVAPPHPLAWGPLVVAGLRSRPEDSRGLTRHTAQQIEITSATPLPVQVDGDAHADVVRVRARIRPGAVEVLSAPW